MADEAIRIVVTMDSNQAERQAGGLTRALGGVASIAGGVLKAGLGAALAGFVALGTGIGFAISEAGEAQAVLAQTNAVIASTGGIAGVSAEELAKWSTELSLVTQFSDDMVQSAGNMLLTFTNINESIFPQTLALTADLAQAWGIDLSQASIMVGKALNDPIAGLGSLSRVGIQFTEDQKLMIQSMVESGDMLGAQTLLMAELERQVGGSAEAFGQTLPGQLAIAKNSVAELAETIGAGLLSVMGGPLATAFSNVTSKIEPIRAAFEQFFLNVEHGMSPVQAFRAAFGELIPEGFVGLFNAVLDTFRSLELLLRTPEIQTALRQIGDALGRVASAEGALMLESLSQSFSAFATFIIRSGPALTTILQGIADVLSRLDALSDSDLLQVLAAGNAIGMSGIKIPGFASGGTIPPGQLAIVGENGPELAIGGAGGTRIIPNDQIGRGGATYQIYGDIHVTQQPGASLDDLMRGMNLAGI